MQSGHRVPFRGTLKECRAYMRAQTTQAAGSWRIRKGHE
jgi:hypothetical protein